MEGQPPAPVALSCINTRLGLRVPFGVVSRGSLIEYDIEDASKRQERVHSRKIAWTTAIATAGYLKVIRNASTALDAGFMSERINRKARR